MCTTSSKAEPGDAGAGQRPRIRRAAWLERFVCRQCGRCCEGSGTVRLRDGESEAIARLLGLDQYDFTQRFTRLGVFRDALELIERADGACIFLTGDGACRIQAAKPRQCRDFPAGWSDAAMERRCPGVRLAQAPPAVGCD